MSAIPGPVYALQVPAGGDLTPASLDFPASVSLAPDVGHFRWIAALRRRHGCVKG